MDHATSKLRIEILVTKNQAHQTRTETKASSSFINIPSQLIDCLEKIYLLYSFLIPATIEAGFISTK